MKYVLVDRHDNIVSSVELESEVGVTGARTYFMGIKQLGGEQFDKLWKVMSTEQYHTQYKISLQNRQIEWWKEDKEITDSELKY